MLYQQLRPTKFEDIFGNEAVISSLNEQIRRKAEDRKHALLIYGPSGCGKTTFARVFASMVGANDEMSRIELNASNTRGIDTVREISNDAQLGTLSGRSRVYIVDESHQLTSAAQEAFLKVIEDTPVNTYFIFCTTEPQSLIATLKQRCLNLQVSKLNARKMPEFIKSTAQKVNFNISDEMVEAVSMISDGAPRLAVNAIDMIRNLSDEEQMLDLLLKNTEVEAGVLDLCLALSEIPENRFNKVTYILKLLNSIQGDSEMIRMSVMKFVMRKMMEATNIADIRDYASIIKKLSVSTFYHGRAALAALVVDVCMIYNEGDKK